MMQDQGRFPGGRSSGGGGLTMRQVGMLVAVVTIGLAVAFGGGRTPVGAQDASPAATPASCPTTTEEQNAAIARRWHEEVVNNHDLSVLDQILAPNVAHD